ncbi:MAG TPA: hypothetical protein VND67_07490, partial [Acidimicrobiales bacterium]|nr:hypothetical protein [Acidimicrobiales bacterium]
MTEPTSDSPKDGATGSDASAQPESYPPAVAPAHPDTTLPSPVSGDEYLKIGPGGEPLGLETETSEGHQELTRRSTTGAGELRREVGAVLRLPEGVAVDPSNIDVEQSDDNTMIINMGPQHPSTHGVLRLMFELDGETVLRTKPVIGYLHTGMEKTAEELT